MHALTHRVFDVRYLYAAPKRTAKWPPLLKGYAPGPLRSASVVVMCIVTDRAREGRKEESEAALFVAQINQGKTIRRTPREEMD